MRSFTGTNAAVPLPDVMGSIIPYRFNPTYTMCQVGTDELFRPTGGRLLFKLRKPDHPDRKTATSNYTDIVTLEELDNILTESNPKSRAVKMYRPDLMDGDENISLVKVAQNVRAFGVSSISQCKDWHRDFCTTAQPVMIAGACHVDKTDYVKQDTLRLPVAMCEVIHGHPQDPRHFVYMTLENCTSKDWRLKFVITPQSTYVNNQMIESDGISLVYSLGIVDYVNQGSDNTSVYVFQPSTANGMKPEHAVLMVEGFVFNPLASWVVTYKENAFEFYSPESMDLWGFVNSPRGDLIPYDPGMEVILPCFLDMMERYKGEFGDDHDINQSDDSDYSLCRRNGEPSAKCPRFYGHGRLGSARNSSSSKALVVTGTHLNDYVHMEPKYRCAVPQTLCSASSSLNFMLNRHKTKPRFISKDVLNNITKPFKKNVANFMSRLNSYVEAEMGSNRRITLCRLAEGDRVTVPAKDTFLILAMAFLDRLRISGNEHAAAERQIDMRHLFHGNNEKLKCLVNYFVKGLIEPNFLKRNLTFYHKEQTDHPDLTALVYPPIDITASGPKIEDVTGTVFADFANNKFGGGVTGRGAVQEEILLIIHPETLLGRALFRPMTRNSACVVMGAVRVSNYTGYGNGSKFGSKPFKYAGTVQYNSGAQTLDVDNRALTEIIAFDAQNFKSNPKLQYRPDDIDSEFNRVVAAFTRHPFTSNEVPITTGLWGSGDYGGDPVLKTLIQVAAAAATNRKIIMVMVGTKVKTDIEKIINTTVELGVTVKNFLVHIIEGVRRQTYGTDRGHNARLTAMGVLQDLSRREQIQMMSTPSGLESPTLVKPVSSSSIDDDVPDYSPADNIRKMASSDRLYDSMETDTEDERLENTTKPRRKKSKRKWTETSSTSDLVSIDHVD